LPISDRLAFLDKVSRLFLKLLARQLQLHAFTAVMVNDDATRAAGELDFGGQRASMQILIAVQIEQRRFLMNTIKLFGHQIDDDVVPIFSSQAMVAIG